MKTNEKLINFPQYSILLYRKHNLSFSYRVNSLFRCLHTCQPVFSVEHIHYNVLNLITSVVLKGTPLHQLT